MVGMGGMSLGGVEMSEGLRNAKAIGPVPATRGSAYRPGETQQAAISYHAEHASMP
jgi:hypothetical protein